MLDVIADRAASASFDELSGKELGRHSEFFDQKIAHLGMIQTVIARMAGESARMTQLGLVTIGALGSVAEATASWPLLTVAMASAG